MADEPLILPDDLVELMTDEEREEYRAYLLSCAVGMDVWDVWLPAMFPDNCYAPFADHHGRFWEWVFDMESDKRPVPFVAVWNRGSGKSSSIEMAVVALGVRKVRRYVLYISGTQDQADDHVSSIAALLESDNLNRSYPELGERAVGKYGSSKGWRRNRLATASGLVVDAMGLDVAARGIKWEDQRPDLIVLDDIDEEGDTPAMTAKKIKAITRKLIPAGSKNCAVAAVQNMVHNKSIFAQLVSENLPGEPPRADFLADRITSGPIPAVMDMEYAQVGDRFLITGGEPSWEGFPMESCQGLLNDIGLSAFLAECQHVEADLMGGMFDHLDFSAYYVPEGHVPPMRRVECWLDPAVTSTDRSDSCGIQLDGLGMDGKIYRLFSWEQVTSPTKAIKVALRACIQWDADVLGVETDNGGDAWEVVFRTVVLQMRNDGLLEDGVRMPTYAWDKASRTNKTKPERITLMLADYETGLFRHVEGTSSVLEKALKRFPKYKPFDLVDAAYWSSSHLKDWKRAKGSNRVVVTNPARGRVMPEPQMTL